MAYKTLPPPGYPGSEMHVFYNITMAVGAQRPNQQADVMLVQLCLQQIYGYPSLFPLVPPGSPIKADGKCGPITENAIWIFQTQMQERGMNVYPDGVVDHAHDWHGVTSTQHSYSILWLNWGLLQMIGAERFAHLDIDRITPAALSVRLGISDF